MVPVFWQKYCAWQWDRMGMRGRKGDTWHRYICLVDTINKIAAGEVIERPMAVVKELIENAIDAKATAVTVEIQDGGKALIRITDNGSGIAREDIELAFAPHATSKIKDVGDLLEVSSLGFRGGPCKHCLRFPVRNGDKTEGGADGRALLHGWGR